MIFLDFLMRKNTQRRDNEEPGLRSRSESLASATFTTVSSEGEDSRQDASESSSRTSAEPEGLLCRLKASDRSVPNSVEEKRARRSKAASIKRSLYGA